MAKSSYMSSQPPPPQMPFSNRSTGRDCLANLCCIGKEPLKVQRTCASDSHLEICLPFHVLKDKLKLLEKCNC